MFTGYFNPLVWSTASDPLCHEHYTAPALGGFYHIAPDEDSCMGKWILQWTIRPEDFCMSYGGPITKHESPEDAQSMAEKDYMNAVRSAIVQTS
jgi:hypothetical protein